MVYWCHRSILEQQWGCYSSVKDDPKKTTLLFDENGSHKSIDKIQSWIIMSPDILVYKRTTFPAVQCDSSLFATPKAGYIQQVILPNIILFTDNFAWVHSIGTFKRCGFHSIFFFTKDRCAGHGSAKYLQGYEVGGFRGWFSGFIVVAVVISIWLKKSSGL